MLFRWNCTIHFYFNDWKSRHENISKLIGILAIEYQSLILEFSDMMCANKVSKLPTWILINIITPNFPYSMSNVGGRPVFDMDEMKTSENLRERS